jgi:glycosyltransferase involved in cell wall biosynthesis
MQVVNQFPSVSVIMPVRNEADFIERAILSIIKNDYPKSELEILVVDGMSDDGTREIIKKLAESDSRIQLIDNAKKTVPHAMNIALKNMKGQYFVRIDGHVEIEDDFIKNSVATLLAKEEAWLAGGYIQTVSDCYIGKAISFAMQSAVGVGNAMFRRGGYEGWVDTLAFGMHHRWILDKIGYFDEQLVRNQDDDFNMRVIKAGGKIWLSKNIKSTYYSRSSLKKHWRQYFQYGFWRIRTIQKHRQPATLRQITPVLFVSSMIIFGLASFAFPNVFWLFAAESTFYSAGLLFGAIDIYRKHSIKYAVIAPLIFCILHFGYGTGGIGDSAACYS